VGADGSIDGNVTLSGPAPRINLGPSGFVNYSLNHPAPSGSLVVPVAITSCMNATSWNATLNNALLGYQFPTPAGAVTPADTSNPNSPQALVHFLARLTNDEPRPVSLIVGLPTLPTGWDFTPALATTPINVPPGGSNLLDFTLRVAKSTAEGEMHLDFQACIQANPRDCATAPATVSMPAVPYFTVKTYIEPATLKEVYRGRSTDVLLFAQNLGNEPTAFEITVGSSPGLNVSFYDGSGPLSLGPQTQVPLALNETRLFVMHVSAIPGASSSVYSLNPTFRNASAGIVQSNLFMSFNLIDPTIDPKVAAVGSRLSVDFTGVTASGLLFDTNQFSMLPLIDQHQRATHPQYVKPAAGSVTPYEVAIQELANYTGTAHKGFEPYLVGSMERETIVFWLTPAQTALPQTAFLKDETLIFEVHITIISAL
jgi:hypothetical protein